MERNRQPVLDLNLFEESDEALMTNIKLRKKGLTVDPTKNLLIGYVKSDNSEYFEDAGLDELQFVDSLPEYKTVRLPIFKTYADTILGKVLD